MQAGRLRARVALQSKTQSVDPLGGKTAPAWSTVATEWAEIVPTAGSGTGEILTAEMVRAGLAVEMRLRYRASLSVTEKMRAVFGSRTFEINAVINEGERNKELRLLCSEIRS